MTHKSLLWNEMVNPPILINRDMNFSKDSTSLKSAIDIMILYISCLPQKDIHNFSSHKTFKKEQLGQCNN